MAVAAPEVERKEPTPRKLFTPATKQCLSSIDHLCFSFLSTKMLRSGHLKVALALAALSSSSFRMDTIDGLTTSLEVEGMFHHWTNKEKSTASQDQQATRKHCKKHVQEKQK